MRINSIFLGLFFVIIAAFSSWIMFHTFSYDSKADDLLISAKVYSDFGNHIPLIRSFSLGENWPPEHPLFPNEPIRYHFLFYFFAGVSERLGARIDLALNFISAAGFFSLAALIFILGWKFFKKVWVGFLAVLMLIFNGSFSFLDFFSTHPFSSDVIKELTSNSVYPSFAPWNDSLISAFWNLNIYTNQRHLGLSFALCLLIIYLINFGGRLKNFTGFLLGSLLLINQAAFIISVIFLIHHFLTRKTSLKFFLWTFFGVFLWSCLYYRTSASVPSLPILKPGYLLPPESDFLKSISYWLLNLGLQLFFIPLGILFAPKHLRRFWLPLLLLFLIPNTFQLSADMINNHKLLNFFVIFGSIFSAGLLVKLWSWKWFGKIIVIIVVPFLFLGGIVDFFPMKNDHFIRVHDYLSNPDAAFFVTQTPKQAVILNNTWFYHPASIAGRRIFNGYPYFTWSYGYDNRFREELTYRIYNSGSKELACDFLLANNIDYLQFSKHSEGFIDSAQTDWLKEMKPEYVNSSNGFAVYSTRGNCIQ